MINYAVLILFRRTLLIFLMCSTTLSAMDFNYPIKNMSILLSESTSQQFTDKNKGNYTLFIDSPNHIYMVSNGNELLKISKRTMLVEDSFSGKDHCLEVNICEQKIINSVNLNQNGILWFCFAQRSITKNTYKEEKPYCYLTLEDSLSKTEGNWQGQSFTSSDFDHRTVSLTIAQFVYVGLHYYVDKQLHVFKNAQTFAGSATTMISIRLPQNFLKAPGDFIFAFQYKNSIFYLLLETDFSCGFRNHQLQTRLLRICNDDPGTSNYEFHALAKIDVDCKTSANQLNSVPHTFTIASAAVWMPQSNELVVSFISKTNEAPSSVLCIYSMMAIENAFNSPNKKSTDNPSYIRNDFPDTCNNFSIKTSSNEYLSNLYTITKTYPLRRTLLSNVTIFQESGSKISHLSFDESVWTTYRRIIVFLGVEYASQSAIIVMSLEPKFCILEKILTQEKISILELSQGDKSVLNIGTSTRLILLPMDRCNSYKTEFSCSSVANPYCGWSKDLQICSYISKESELKFFTQSLSVCPKGTNQTDQIYSRSDIVCRLISVSDQLKQIGTCTCRLISYVPNKIDITTSKFCQVDGGWSPFSDWSDCSVTCDSGFQSRTRNCDSPAPKGDGNKCEGLKLEMRPCKTNIECKKKFDVTNQLALISKWSSWSACTSTCGFSYKIRTRNCLTDYCIDNMTEKKLCEMPICKSSIASEWSKWSKFNKPDLSTKRFRVQCIGTYYQHPYPMSINVLMGKNKTTTCIEEQCFQKYTKNLLNERLTLWSEWSSCSASCGVGIKVRSRKCSEGNCLGSTTDVLRCNVHPCQSIWSCWSDWNGCSLSCETPKIKTRRRECMPDLYNNACNGINKEDKECDLIPCTDAYGQWSMWSNCRTDGVIVRTRKCKFKRQCMLPLLQSKPCPRASLDQPLLYNSMYMIVSGIVGLLGGVVLGSVICYIWWRCTMRVIQRTRSESLRISNPMQTEEISHSQSLNTIPDTFSSVQRQRSTSNSDSYFIPRYMPPYRDDGDSYTQYSSPVTFVDYRSPLSAQRQPLPEVDEH